MSSHVVPIASALRFNANYKQIFLYNYHMRVRSSSTIFAVFLKTEVHETGVQGFPAESGLDGGKSHAVQIAATATPLTKICQ
eukprot:3506555-Amphidinium_carterae.1